MKKQNCFVGLEKMFACQEPIETIEIGRLYWNDGKLRKIIYISFYPDNMYMVHGNGICQSYRKSFGKIKEKYPMLIRQYSGVNKTYILHEHNWSYQKPFETQEN